MTQVAGHQRFTHAGAADPLLCWSAMGQLPPANILAEGSTIQTFEGSARIEHRSAGSLRVRGRRIVACDPLVPMDRAPFSVAVEPGAYDVVLGVARSDEVASIAFALVRFRDAPVERWEMAHGEDDDMTDLADGHGYGYAVDSGTGCFLDERTARHFFERMDGDDASFGKTLLATLERNREAGLTWGDVDVDGSDGGNVIMFQSGSGDGVYTSWFGFDHSGSVVCLVTDFGIEVPEPRQEKDQTKGAPAKRWFEFWK